MIAHVVLLRPRPDLTTLEVDQLLQAFDRALRDIPCIRRSHVGRRVLTGRGYEQLMRADYPYAALLEFDGLDDLRNYLEHPSHSAIGAAVFSAAADILVYDFDMGAGVAGLSAVATPP